MKTCLPLVLLLSTSLAHANAGDPVSDRATEKVRSLIAGALAQMGRSHHGVVASNLGAFRFMYPDGIHIEGYCSNIYDQSSCDALRFATGDGFQCSVYFHSHIYPEESARDQLARIRHVLDLTPCERNGDGVFMRHDGSVRRGI